MSVKTWLQNRVPLFTDVNRFGEEIEFWPAGDSSSAKKVHAVVDMDSMPGTNENIGDGRTLNRPPEKGVRESVVLEMPDTIPVRRKQPDSNPDLFKIGSETYAVQKILSKDFGGLMQVLCILHRATKLRNTTKTG